MPELGAHHRVGEHRLAREDRGDLVGPGEPCLHDAVGGQAFDPVPIENDLAGGCPRVTRDHIEQGGLAGSVGAGNAEDLATGNREGELTDRGQTAVVLREIGDLEERVGHASVRSPESGCWSAQEVSSTTAGA
jgi:hypothetical protein